MESIAASIYLDLMYVVTGVLVFLCLASILDAFYLPRPRIDVPLTSLQHAPLVSIIIPARNEEKNIARCIESLLLQDYPNFELLVVDDRSTDRTAAIVSEFSLRDPRVRLLRGKHLSEEWLGKSHALYQGVREARGTWFLFVDADTWHHPKSLSATMNHCLRRGVDMLSLYPHFVCKSFWEKVIQPAVGRMILIAAPSVLVNSTRRLFLPFYMAIGQFILIKKSVYEATGGHLTVRKLVTEDVELAKLVKHSGHTINFLYGIDLLHTHMYEHFSEIWKGWSRSFYPAMGNNPVVASLEAMLLFIFGTMPYLTLPVTALVFLVGYRDPLIGTLLKIGLVQWSVVFASTLIVRWRLNEYPQYFFTCPIGGIMVQWIALHSLYSYALGKRVLWKGRNLT